MLVPLSMPSDEKSKSEDQKKTMKLKKGRLSVSVGSSSSSSEEEEEGEKNGSSHHQRFDVPIWYLCHPLFEPLLEKAHEVYGYRVTGPLRLPCSPDEFLRLRCQIERESNFCLQYRHPPQLKYLA